VLVEKMLHLEREVKFVIVRNGKAVVAADFRDEFLAGRLVKGVNDIRGFKRFHQKVPVSVLFLGAERRVLDDHIGFLRKRSDVRTVHGM